LLASRKAQYTLEPFFVKYLTDSLTVKSASLQLLFFLKPYLSESLLKNTSYRCSKTDFFDIIPQRISGDVMIDGQFLTLFYELMIFTTRHDTTNIAVKQYSTLLVLNQTTRVTYN